MEPGLYAEFEKFLEWRGRQKTIETPAEHGHKAVTSNKILSSDSDSNSSRESTPLGHDKETTPDRDTNDNIKDVMKEETPIITSRMYTAEEYLSPSRKFTEPKKIFRVSNLKHATECGCVKVYCTCLANVLMI